MRLINWLVTLPLAVVAAAFAVWNRETVVIAFFPLPFEIEMAKAMVGLLPLAAGLIIGALLVWSQSLRLRAAMRRGARRIDALEAENATLRQRIAAYDHAAGGVDRQATAPSQPAAVPATLPALPGGIALQSGAALPIIGPQHR